VERTARRALAVDAALLVAIKAAIGVCVLVTGFRYVSDDDFARVSIAERFAAAPSLDPSGTSWLPFPFWVMGGAMMALGRSLAVARGVAFALGALSVVPPYLALRAAGGARWSSLVGVAVAAALPWSAWLGVATVPESMCAGLIAAGAIAATTEPAAIAGALALLAASLSRYEAWPVAAVFAVVCVVRRRGRGVVPAAIALAGPAAWIAWNAHAHGDPLHFVARVAAYRRAIGAASSPLVAKLAEFPLAVLITAPLVVLLAVPALIALRADRDARARWTAPLLGAAALLAFLVYGDARDGAPTHHPERAALPIVWILSTFVADVLIAAARAWAQTEGAAAARARLFGRFAVGIAAVWCVTLPIRWFHHPAKSPSESREAVIARGEELRARGVSHIVVAPCAYEHFALVAAFGAPERVTIVPAASSPPNVTASPVTADCPRVEER
jgi:hypothetical protein